MFETQIKLNLKNLRDDKISEMFEYMKRNTPKNRFFNFYLFKA